jgi:3-phosphoshikimate 1-carboxyvinyltransferase
VAGGGHLAGISLALPGDFSSAAFLLVAGLIVPGSEIVVHNVGINPTRTGLLGVLREMGASIEVERGAGDGSEPAGSIRVRGGPLRGVAVAPALLPLLIDEVPVLCIAAACADGETSITGATELRVKESDRIAAMASGLRDCGVTVEELPDGLVIQGRGSVTRGGALPLRGGRVRCAGDHRVAMAFAVAGLVAAGGICVEDAEAADVSFPGFYPCLRGLIGR